MSPPSKRFEKNKRTKKDLGAQVRHAKHLLLFLALFTALLSWSALNAESRPPSDVEDIAGLFTRGRPAPPPLESDIQHALGVVWAPLAAVFLGCWVWSRWNFVRAVQAAAVAVGLAFIVQSIVDVRTLKFGLRMVIPVGLVLAGAAAAAVRLERLKRLDAEAASPPRPPL